MWNFTKSAKGTVESRWVAMIPGILRFSARSSAGASAANGASDGDARSHQWHLQRTPLFSADTGAPVVTPKVLSVSERDAVYAAV